RVPGGVERVGRLAPLDTRAERCQNARNVALGKRAIQRLNEGDVLTRVRHSVGYFASGSGRTWNFTSLLVVPRPPSMWNGARVEMLVKIPFPFQPPFGSSIRPSIPFA